MTMGLWLSAVAVAGVLAMADSSKPNFVILFGDDWGYGDLGVNWDTDLPMDPKFPRPTFTKNLDALAASGIRFTDFHAGASVCTPSRAALMTGRLGLRTGVTHNFSPGSIAGLPTTEITIAAHLKAHGYATAMLGKWHMGTTPEYSPTYHGFDEWFGLPYSDDMGCVDAPWPNLPMDATCVKEPIDGAHGNSPKWPLPLYNSTGPNCSGQTAGNCDADILEQPANLETLSARYAMFAETFLAKAAASEQPFLLYAAFAHMHVPQFSSDANVGRTGKGHFADALAELDDTVGSIITSLETHGLRKSTLVFVTGDNGPWEVKCNLTGSKGPFLGTWQAMDGGGSSAKTTLWEAGHRTIGLASWPGMIDAGRVSAATTSTLDYFATLASLAEAPLPTDRVYDGIDLSPVLFNKAESARTTLFHPNSGASGVNGALDAVRYYDLKAVYQTGGAPGCGGGKGPSIHRVTPLLFNLTADPAEEHALDPKVYAAHISTIDQIREDIGNNINNTFKSFTDYTTNDASEPCCNTANRGKGCRCTE